MEQRHIRGRSRKNRAELSRRIRRRRRIQLLFTAGLLVFLAAAGGVFWLFMEGRRTADRAALRDVAKDVVKLPFPGDEGDGWRPMEETVPPDGGRDETAKRGNKTTQKGDSVEKVLADMTLNERVLQMFYITPEALTGVREVYAAGARTKEALKKYPVGGIVYFKQNLKNTDQVKDMLVNVQKYSRDLTGIPLFLGVDEEGGEVARISGRAEFGIAAVQDMKEIGATGNPKKAYEVGEQIGGYLSELGFNMDFAPVADVLTNPKNKVVARRSFGEDGAVVAEFVKAEMDGFKAKEIYPVLKHFPGHGGTEMDTHQGYACTEQTLEQLLEEDLVPFKEGIDAGAQFVMAAHIAAPKVTGNETPASLSQVLITEVLREKLEFDGVVITDALNMKAVTTQYNSKEAAVLAVQAGADMLLMPENFEEAYQGILEAVEDGTISETRIEESVRRILRVKLGE